MIPTKDEAKAILAPYHAIIVSVIESAWADWKLMQMYRSDNGLPQILYHRTIANYIFDGIAQRAILSFAAESKVAVTNEAQTFKLHFNGLSARFKKGGDDKLGCNIPTRAALLFAEADGVFPGLPPENGKVEIIWLPNEIWTDLDRILVIARDGDRLIWEYEIERSAPAVEMKPRSGKPDDSNPSAPLITPKPAVKPDIKRP